MEQLGESADDKVDVRIGAIYSLEQIARDWPKEFHGPVMEIFTAFLRGHSRPQEQKLRPEDQRAGSPAAAAAPDEAMRLPADFQAIAMVLSRRGIQRAAPPLDLKGVDLRGEPRRGPPGGSEPLGRPPRGSEPHGRPLGESTPLGRPPGGGNTLDVEHLELEAGTLAVLGKGQEGRELLTLPSETITVLRAWLEQRGQQPGPLFLNFDQAGKGRRLTSTSIYRVVRDLGDQVQIRARPHGLRHAAITAVLDLSQGDVRAAARFSRHADIRTLTVYDVNRQDMGGQMAGLLAAAL